MRESFFTALYRIMKQDKRIILLISDTGAIVLNDIRRDFPKRCINVGIAEENMASVASGLALCGKIVYIYAIIPFVTMRCYEQIRVDICCQNLPVKIIGIGAGLDYSTLGPTHHGHEDIALMRVLPGMTILSPSDKRSTGACARISYAIPGPVYVRLERYGGILYKDPGEKFLDGLKILRKGSDICIIATGKMTAAALKIEGILAKGKIEATVIDLYRIKPLNTPLLLETIGNTGYVVTIEEHSIIGGIGSAVSEILIGSKGNLQFKSFGMPDRFCRQYGSREYLHSLINIDVKGVAKNILQWLKR